MKTRTNLESRFGKQRLQLLPHLCCKDLIIRETDVAVVLSHNLEKNQPKTLSEEFPSFLEEKHQTTKVQDEVESCFVEKEISLFEATKKDQKICKNCSMPFLQSNQRLWSQKCSSQQWNCLQQDLEAN